MSTHNLSLPLTESQVRTLDVGDTVFLSGEIVITAGLPTHERILAHIAAGEPLPIDLREAGFFHLGSFNREADGRFEVLYINPTTSTRFSPHMPAIIRAFNLRAVGGKGGLDRQCVLAMQEVGCVYLSFLGGGCTPLSAAVQEVVAVGWNDLIAHYRLVQLRVSLLGPLTVAIDARGNSLYDQLQAEATRRLPEILRTMEASRK